MTQFLQESLKKVIMTSSREYWISIFSKKSYELKLCCILLNIIINNKTTTHYREGGGQ